MFSKDFMWLTKQRSDKPELMDDPACDTVKLIRTVKQFKVINPLFSGSRKLIKRYFLKRLLSHTEKSYTFVDLGAGGCDIALWVSSWCRKRDINIKIICIENDRKIVTYAQEQISSYDEITLLDLSAFDIPRDIEYDFIYSNHFLHHLPNSAIVELLKILDSVAKSFLMNDLKRSVWSLIGYKIFAGLFLHRSFANYDGGLSILRGFKKSELKTLVSKVGKNSGIDIKESLPGRIFLLKNMFFS